MRYLAFEILNKCIPFLFIGAMQRGSRIGRNKSEKDENYLICVFHYILFYSK